MAIFTPRRSYYRRSRWNRRTTVNNRSRGNYRAALAQKDSGEYVINVLSTFTVSNNRPVFAINIYDVILHSELYQHFSPMFDQIKINRVRFKLTPESVPINRSLNVVTAWDRNGLDTPQISDATLASASSPSGKPGDWETITTDTSTRCTLTAQELASYSSSVTKALSPGSSFSMVRYLAPSSLQEKSEYVSIQKILEWWDSRAYAGVYTVLGSESEGFDADDQKELISGHIASNPAYLQSSDTLAWKPTLLIGVTSFMATFTTYDETTDSQVSMATFNIEFDVNVTFRGMRKSSVM